VTEDDAYAWLVAEPGVTGLFVDYDGTLAPIVPIPEQARPGEGAVAAIRQLAKAFRVMAIVSGRPIDWLAEAVELEAGSGLHAYGLHGIEHSDGHRVELAAGVEEWRAAVAAVVAEVPVLQAVGLSVEDKLHGVTLHWRQAAEPDRARAAAEAAAARACERGLLARPGKASIELVVPIGVDKGTVVAHWAGEGIERAAFFGDDVSDVLAFEAIDTLLSRGELRAGLKVGVAAPDTPEAPSGLRLGADLLLPGPPAVVRLLRRVAAHVAES
jgi:trehalose 6-phosphate phosphatase